MSAATEPVLPQSDRTERHRSVVDVYVLLRRADGRILLLGRSGTGYAAIWTGRPEICL